MAMTTNGEAEAANTLAHILLGDPRPGFGLPTAEQVCNALALLAESGHKKLMAGYSGQNIHELWPGKPGSLAAILVAAEQARTEQAGEQASVQTGEVDDDE